MDRGMDPVISVDVFDSLDGAVGTREKLPRGGLLVYDFMEDTEGGLVSFVRQVDEGKSTAGKPVVGIGVKRVDTRIYLLEASGGPPTSLRIEFMLKGLAKEVLQDVGHDESPW